MKRLFNDSIWYDFISNKRLCRCKYTLKVKLADESVT